MEVDCLALVDQMLIDVSSMTDEQVAAAVRQFGGDEQAWRHEGLALAMLRDVMADTDTRLDQLSEALTRAYFSHVPAAQAVGSSGG